MSCYFCKLVPPRAGFASDITPDEAAVMQLHALYWKELIDRGQRVFALGLVLDPAGAFGIGVLEAEDEAAMLALTDHDPAIEAGIGMHYEIHPMPRGVMHN
ncbi:MAG TPA: YciI family protein [Rhodanobacteraceae bacterium]|nr:YciI family protein [Rhodanobacteraceae bacterium]